MRRRRLSLPIPLAALAALLLAGTAQAANPKPAADGAAVPQPLAVAAASPQPAAIGVFVKGLRNGYAQILSRHAVIGRLKPWAPGQTVKVYLYRGDSRAWVRELPVTKVPGEDAGEFTTALEVNDDARFTVRAKHPESPELALAHAKRKHFGVSFPSLRSGDRGPEVKLFNHLLDRVGYVFSDSRRYDGATGRGVLAFRRVNHMSETMRTATPGMFRQLFHRNGGYPLKHPGAGHHVEADLSLQVMALAKGGDVQRAYAVSSGKPSTPTIRGRFRFYRRQPGYNSLRMYYTVYFRGGYAIHGYSSVPNYPASHGCLREFIADARAVYNWVRLGDSIYVYG